MQTKTFGGIGKLILAGMAILACAAAVPAIGAEPSPPASGPGGRTPDPDQALKHLASQLTLSAEQQKQIRPILADELGQLRQLMSNSSLSRSDQQAKMESIRNTSFERMRPILTPEQQQKHEELRRQDMERGRKGRGAGRQD
jgi:Spy/CpxP family protein refolding chaperone